MTDFSVLPHARVAFRTPHDLGCTKRGLLADNLSSFLKKRISLLKQHLLWTVSKIKWHKKGVGMVAIPNFLTSGTGLRSFCFKSCTGSAVFELEANQVAEDGMWHTFLMDTYSQSTEQKWLTPLWITDKLQLSFFSFVKCQLIAGSPQNRKRI